ncbi:MAG: phosphate ABC transporter substrate-binding protein PstS [Hydrogenophaga sp.]|nr:phosphate ABC transporter substrate-binding protein PstS [Hydrogenophaga sp.]
MINKRIFLQAIAAAAMATAGMGSAIAADITGAGATFPFPIYAKWAEMYKAQTGTGMNYQSIGSSGGMRQIRAKTVAFGATDAPISGAELDKDGMVQFPAIIGGTIPVFNLDGFAQGEVRITGQVLAEMFLGKITNWNDPKIAALNPGKTFPSQAVTVVHRADGSGTTFNFTDYLSVVSKDWADTVGKGAAVKWPAPTSIGGRGNEGVAANVSRTKGAIGYVEYAYAKKNNIPYMSMQNADGKFVRPDDKSFEAAAAGVDWFSVPGMGVSMVNAKGALSWPISTASFIVMYKEPTNKAESAEVLKFFDWAFKNGGAAAVELDYVPIPAAVTQQIATRVWSQINNK